MRATSSVQSFAFEPVRAAQRDDDIMVLGEIVAQLAERVELLEAREQISRAAFVKLEAGTVQGRE